MKRNAAINEHERTCPDCQRVIAEMNAVSRPSHERGADARPGITTLGEQEAYQAGYDAGHADALAPSMELVPAPTLPTLDARLRRMVDPLTAARNNARVLDEQMQGDPRVIGELRASLAELNRMLEALRDDV